MQTITCFNPHAPRSAAGPTGTKADGGLDGRAAARSVPFILGNV